MKPLAAPIIAKAIVGPREDAPPPLPRQNGRTGPERTKRRRWWLRTPVPLPARFMLGRRPTAERP